MRILRSTVMVRVGGGWVALDEFLVKNDPCRGTYYWDKCRENISWNKILWKTFTGSNIPWEAHRLYRWYLPAKVLYKIFDQFKMNVVF